jgi:uncharacterized protein
VVETVQPTRTQVLEFCSLEPVERVFLEDVARREIGHFVATEDDDGSLSALCHVGANIVPSGPHCELFATAAARGHARMVIGEQRAVTALWDAARDVLPPAREDRPGQPVYAIDVPPLKGETGLRAAEPGDLERLLPAAAAAHELELGLDPLGRDAEAFRWRTLAQIEEGRSWVWLEDGRIAFKAEASAWTPSAVQLQQVWVDPALRNRGYAKRAMRDLCRTLLERVPTVCLFVRPENDPALHVYEGIGMHRTITYRSLIF